MGWVKPHHAPQLYRSMHTELSSRVKSRSLWHQRKSFEDLVIFAGVNGGPFSLCFGSFGLCLMWLFGANARGSAFEILMWLGKFEMRE
jgi:hypothetical protein